MGQGKHSRPTAEATPTPLQQQQQQPSAPPSLSAYAADLATLSTLHSAPHRRCCSDPLIVTMVVAWEAESAPANATRQRLPPMTPMIMHMVNTMHDECSFDVRHGLTVLHTPYSGPNWNRSVRLTRAFITDPITLYPIDTGRFSRLRRLTVDCMPATVEWTAFCIATLTHLEMRCYAARDHAHSSLPVMPQLRVLRLSHAYASIVPDVALQPALIELSFSSTRVDSLSALAAAPCLRILRLVRAEVKSFEGLECCAKLEELHITDPSLLHGDLACFASSSSLRVVTLRAMPVPWFVHLEGLPALDLLSLHTTEDPSENMQSFLAGRRDRQVDVQVPRFVALSRLQVTNATDHYRDVVFATLTNFTLNQTPFDSTFDLDVIRVFPCLISITFVARYSDVRLVGSMDSTGTCKKVTISGHVNVEDMKNSFRANIVSLGPLSGCSTLRSLTLANIRNVDVALASLVDVPHLRELSVAINTSAPTKLSDPVIGAVIAHAEAHFPELDSFYIDGTDIVQRVSLDACWFV